MATTGKSRWWPRGRSCLPLTNSERPSVSNCVHRRRSVVARRCLPAGIDLAPGAAVSLKQIWIESRYYTLASHRVAEGSAVLSDVRLLGHPDLGRGRHRRRPRPRGRVDEMPIETRSRCTVGIAGWSVGRSWPDMGALEPDAVRGVLLDQRCLPSAVDRALAHEQAR
jgi:hypothetical protein